MNQPTVVIEEVLGRAQQGMTHPFICRGDDGDIYYVKGFGAGRRSQICEWVAARLANLFGLPIAEYALADTPQELVMYSTFPGIRDLGSGIVFASRALPHVQELNVTTREHVPEELACDVLVFDWWLHNEDRHLTELGGNPNLLWDVESEELVVIDHNQCFDPTFNAARFLDTHVFKDHWNRIFSDHIERAAYLGRMNRALAELEVIRASIPDSWWHVDEGVPADVTWDEIVARVASCHAPDFWNTP